MKIIIALMFAFLFCSCGIRKVNHSSLEESEHSKLDLTSSSSVHKAILNTSALIAESKSSDQGKTSESETLEITADEVTIDAGTGTVRFKGNVKYRGHKEKQTRNDLKTTGTTSSHSAQSEKSQVNNKLKIKADNAKKKSEKSKASQATAGMLSRWWIYLIVAGVIFLLLYFRRLWW